MQHTLQGFRLSPQQRRLWLLEPGLGTLRAECTVSIEGDIEAEKLQGALDQVVSRHEILRTEFRRAAGMKVPMQVILDRGGVIWQRLERPQAPGGPFAGQEGSPCEPRIDSGLQGSLVSLAPGRSSLVLSLPALCADARTLRNVVREMVQVLAGRGEPDEVVQYLQFSEWQHELLSEEADSEGAEHWRRQDLSSLGSLTFPRELQPDGLAFGGFSSFSWSLPLELVRKTAAIAAERGIEESDVLLAVLHALIFRLTGRRETVCGLLVDARKLEELEDSLGPMSGFLPICLELDDDMPFGTLLRRSHRAARQAGEWQEHFWHEGQVAEPTPLPVVFEWDVAPVPLRTGEAIFEIVEQCADVDLPKLRLSCLRRSEDILATWRYDPRYFDAGEVRHLAGRLQTLLANAVDSPRALLGELEVCGELDRAWLLQHNDRIPEPSRPADCAHHMFEFQAARVPAALAAECGGETLTYSQLDARADRLARRLRGLGVGRGSIVALYLDRSLEALTGLLGVLKSGGAYLALDLTYPQARLRYMLDDSGAALVLTRQPLCAGLPADCPRALCLDRLEDEAGEEGAARLEEAGPDDLAYVLYTSGSSGRPKGVMITHRGLVNYLSWCAGAYRIDQGEGAPVHSSLGFDLTVTSLLGPLAVGRRAVLLAADDGLETLTAELLSGRAFSLLKLTPAHLEILGQRLEGVRTPVRVGTLVVGGEALRGESLAPWWEIVPESRVVNEYGPTETVVGCCVRELCRSDGPYSGAVPIGTPIANTGMYVVNSRLMLQPPGVPGEILIGGDGLARGYLGRPDLTAEKMIPDPFSGSVGARLYRTGDLGRWRADGDLEFLGRIDHQIKIRGFRIELGEIESVLTQHPLLREAVVVARAEPGREPYLVAYTVAAGDGEPEPGSLRSWLAEHLPEPMIPADYVALRSLPLTVHGKVDRAALPVPQARGRSGYVAPRTPLELQLVRIWEGLLGISPIGIRDNFFACGGHSLIAVRLMMQIRNQYGVELPVASILFKAVTIESLASLLSETGTPVAWSPLVEIQPGGSQPPLFLVHPHGGTVLCYLDLARHLGPDQPVYGLQARGREDDRPPLERVEEMAAFYLSSLRRVQPSGPYRLGGWSLGGVVAYEIAQQLVDAGEKVELLAILDSNLRQKGPLDDDAEFLVEFLGQDLSISMDDVRGCRDRDELLELAHRRAQQKNLFSHELDLADVHRYFHYYKVTYNAGQLYRPRPYPGRICLLLSTQRIDREPRDPSYGLAELAEAGLEIFAIEGLHQDAVAEPKVAEVASWLGRLLKSRGWCSAR
jgi:amino acid adenylation domain-containing protein